MRHILVICLIIFFSIAVLNAFPQNECVILLHGLGDVKYSMLKLENDLKDAGYFTKNIGYKPVKETIEFLSERELVPLVQIYQKMGFEKIHFVTHSMGGLIVRYFLQENKLPEGSRIVMLSPPNRGSEVADYFAESPFFNLLVGDVGKELATDSDFLSKLKKIKPDVGIIAGTKSTNPLFSRIIPGDDDGRVSVENTKLAEMDDFFVVPNTHLTIKYSNLVAYQIQKFLVDGKFDHDEK
ncbi:MAG: hypothetical protein HN952_08495 [Candidatus Cloacimonetes bacterium]|jgi:triacylglycerol lipase|nr:hypothetical protein [Candidatus Cloacimonadota bacterium]MBT6994974.1 hypothetical protein [Candidatus Cloacimonadota bacterium]MBT7469806.1 hypothetical protein [Candidatus Cloacimonadota bacterium]